ncbi:hypothetical protein M3Y98_01177900 [Aphelenchoides besseyi]|nr:hypothetical protein M3Y98_01177900 [Aphelenchoides besseyi]KAI6211039.1 hypothetical protein M3Y96_00391100 [Aphelenchoides besseyi]
MTQKLGNTTGRKQSRLEAGQAIKNEANSDKYRIACAHVHILALAIAMVAFCLHLLLTYRDIKQKMYSRMVRHVPCMLLYAMVIYGNRVYRRLFYWPYFLLNALSVVYIISMEAVRQYRLRTDPHTRNSNTRTIWFFIGFWCLSIVIETIIFYVIYRDYKFVKDVQANPPKHLKPIVHVGEKSSTVSPA